MSKFYMAEIRNIDDPSYSGSCQVRIYNRNNDEQNVKDEHLKWAVPLHPTTSAATAGVGVIPQMIPGSRVLITYLEDDTAEQFPIIIGTLARGQLPSDRGVSKESDKDSGGKIDTTKAAPDGVFSSPDYKFA